MSCDGTCCAVFTVNGSMDRLRQGPTVGYLASGLQDGDLLGFMLRELTHDEAVERQERFGAYPGRELGDRQFYKCIYWDEDTRLCGAYGNRPQMCSEYPYPWQPGNTDAVGQCVGIGGVCEHGCDCKGAPLLWDGED